MSLFKNFIKAFLNSEINAIREMTSKFAHLVTTAIMREEISNVKKLCDNSVLMREEIEFTKPIKRTEEFYLGYWYAYENIARRLSEKQTSDNRIEIALSGNAKLRKIVSYLATNPYANHKEIADFLDVSPSQLTTFFKKDNYFENLKILSVDKVGRNLVYTLTEKGKHYFLQQIAQTYKRYSKAQIIDILSLIQTKNLSLSDINNKLGILDEELVELIYAQQINLLVERSSTKWDYKDQPKYSRKYKKFNGSLGSLSGQVLEEAM